MYPYGPSHDSVVTRTFQMLAIVLVIYLAQTAFHSFVNEFSAAITIDSVASRYGKDPNYIRINKGSNGNGTGYGGRSPASIFD